MRLSERVGQKRVMKGLDRHHFLPGAKSICELFERAVQAGLGKSIEHLRMFAAPGATRLI